MVKNGWVKLNKRNKKKEITSAAIRIPCNALRKTNALSPYKHTKRRQKKITRYEIWSPKKGSDDPGGNEKRM